MLHAAAAAAAAGAAPVHANKYRTNGILHRIHKRFPAVAAAIINGEQQLPAAAARTYLTPSH